VHFHDELKAIMEVHEDTKMIQCTECNVEFKSNSAFIYHAKRCLRLEESDKNDAVKEFL
jgi:hypothetical protein